MAALQLNTFFDCFFELLEEHRKIRRYFMAYLRGDERGSKPNFHLKVYI